MGLADLILRRVAFYNVLLYGFVIGLYVKIWICIQLKKCSANYRMSGKALDKKLDGFWVPEGCTVNFSANWKKYSVIESAQVLIKECL